ncbi:SGNH/GDSL hydrolase family protein [Campylobacter sp.]|uniref:SGNH/GDSL hydrolase family protein n=1 Tax=Campylobacter sp. TaxID=205 RepID=UPI0025BE113A|nr:SGNH/GDSL hydrolase family protein [Campylobacter sp.]
MNVILLGGSNSVVKNGLRVGLEQKNVTLHNFSLGLSSSLQNLYELIRQEKIISKADFIVSESNINDYLSPIDLEIILRNIDYFYEQLYKAQKTTIILILPIPTLNEKAKAINETHRKNCFYYGFNLIDLDTYFLKNNLYSFDLNYKFHPMPLAMQKLGKNIIENISFFKKSKEKILCSKRKFYIYTPSNLPQYEHKNSFFCEKVTKITKDGFTFPKNYLQYQILGIHTWTKNYLTTQAVSTISIENTNFKLIKNFNILNSFQDIQNNNAFIDDQTSFYVNTTNIKHSEESSGVSTNANTTKLDYVDLIGILLLKDDKFKKIEHIFSHTNTNDFLIPPIAFYKDLIVEYQELIKLDNKSFLQNQNHNLIRFIEYKKLQNEFEIFTHQNTQLYGANLRIKARLSYKLGEVIIRNSKSLTGYFKIPFELAKTKKMHIKEDKNLPPLKAYADYKQAQIAKTHLPYLLGNALIQASKSPFKIAYITLPFKLKKIAKNYKKRI